MLMFNLQLLFAELFLLSIPANISLFLGRQPNQPPSVPYDTQFLFTYERINLLNVACQEAVAIGGSSNDMAALLLQLRAVGKLRGLIFVGASEGCAQIPIRWGKVFQQVERKVCGDQLDRSVCLEIKERILLMEKFLLW